MSAYRGSSVTTVARLRTGRPGFNCRKGQWWDVSLRHRVQTCSGAHPASYPMGTAGSFSSGKAAGAWSYTIPQYVCMEWCL